jgi:hypothetical protein
VLLNATQIRFLQGLVADRPESRLASGAATAAAEHFGIGQRNGRKVIYSSTDHLGAEQLLRSNGIPTVAGAPSDRAGRMEFTGHSEKTGSARPHSNSVAVKTVSGVVTIDGQTVPALAGGYTVVTVESALRLRADSILVVENLETFRWLDRYGWLDYGEATMAAIFRGDACTSPADSLRFLQRTSLPVWAFYDFDPAGLGMVLCLPRVDRLILPNLQWLQTQARLRRRTDLYDDSLAQWGNTLKESSRHDVAAAWRAMQSLRCGFPQEWMESAPSMELAWA